MNTKNDNKAEAKQSPAARRKVARRQSAKASDTNWAIKTIRSESGYKEMSPEKEAAMQEAQAQAVEATKNSSLSVSSHNDSLLANVAARGSEAEPIIEEVEEEEEEEEEEKGYVAMVAEDKEDDTAIATPTARATTTPTAKATTTRTSITTATSITKDAAQRFNVEVLKLSMLINDASTAEDRKGWYYANAEGGEEGPFQTEWMHSWLADKSLHSDTMIRFGDGETFIKLSSLIPDCEGVGLEGENPFEIRKGGGGVIIGEALRALML